MSAYMVDKAHIDALLDGVQLYSRHWGFSWYWSGTRSQLGQGVTIQELGQLLVNANLASIHARYPDSVKNPDNTPGPIARYWEIPYRFERRERFSPVELLKALDGFEYQACETETWEESEAFAACRAMRRTFIHALPGYDDGPWEITADTVPADIARNLKKYAELNRAMTNRTA